LEKEEEKEEPIGRNSVYKRKTENIKKTLNKNRYDIGGPSSRIERAAEIVTVVITLLFLVG